MAERTVAIFENDGAHLRVLNVAIIGCGEHCRQHLLPSVQQVSGVRILLLCDNEEVNLAAALGQAPNAESVHEFESVAERSDVDAVILAGPPQLHVAASKALLRTQKHVFVEKPPSVTLSELEELAEIAAKRSLITCVGHNLRHSAALKEANRIIRDEHEGAPLFASISYLCVGPAGSRWGLPPLKSVLLSHGLHVIDLVLFLLGEATSTNAEIVDDAPEGTTVAFRLRFQNGSLAQGVISTHCTRFNLETRVILRNGALVSVDQLKRLSVCRPGGRGKRWSEVWEPKTLLSGYDSAGYYEELSNFFRAIRAGREASPSFSDELRAYRIVEEIERQLIAAGHNDGPHIRSAHSRNRPEVRSASKEMVMDPLGLITTAIAAGAAAAAKGTASEAVKDAYAGLKALLHRHFGEKHQGSIALNEFETDSETWKKPLEKAIKECRVTEDRMALSQADQILKLLHPSEHASGKYAVQITGDVQGMQIGDYGTQHNVFGGKTSDGGN